MDPDAVASAQPTMPSPMIVCPAERESSFWILVRPAKAGIFNGSQSHEGKSQSPVAWVASVEETKRMKPTDKAILKDGE